MLEFEKQIRLQFRKAKRAHRLIKDATTMLENLNGHNPSDVISGGLTANCYTSLNKALDDISEIIIQYQSYIQFKQHNANQDLHPL